MTNDDLKDLFKACGPLQAKKNVYTVGENAVLDLLMEAGSSGPAPLAKVQKLTLGSSFIEVETEEHTYLLPNSAVLGLKWKEKGESRSARTGFHA